MIYLQWKKLPLHTLSDLNYIWDASWDWNVLRQYFDDILSLFLQRILQNIADYHICENWFSTLFATDIIATGIKCRFQTSHWNCLANITPNVPHLVVTIVPLSPPWASKNFSSSDWRFNKNSGTCCPASTRRCLRSRRTAFSTELLIRVVAWPFLLPRPVRPIL
jgi:hypothetical protein